MFERFGRKTPSSLFVVRKTLRLGQVPGSEGATDPLAEEIPNGTSGGRFLGSVVPNRRFLAAGVALIAALGILAARAGQLQLMEGAHYRSVAEGNRVRVVRDLPARGTIFDRHGKILAKNIPTFVLRLTYRDLPKEGRDAILARVTELAGLARTDLDLSLTEASRHPDDPVTVAKGLAYEAAMRLAVEEPTLPGFYLEAGSLRGYESSARSLSHVLGYVGTVSESDLETFAGRGYRSSDEVGKSGIERGAEAVLRGEAGETAYEVDAYGKELAVIDRKAGHPGADLTLTIDADLQAFVEKATLEAMGRAGVKRASVVAVDPRDGSIRALVSLPSYDDNSFARGIDADTYGRLVNDPNRPLFARAIAGEYPSGSTFKPFVAYAALKEGVITERTSFLSVGGIRVGPWFFPDWLAGGHGITDVRKAIAMSVNTFFYTIGGGYEQTVGLGVERITAYARRFGFGAKTGLPLPGEADGFLPSKAWKEEAKGERWYVGDTYNLSIGQGDLLVTPLQMAIATAEIANGGTPIPARLVAAMDGGGEDASELLSPPVVGEPLDANAVRIVREGMRQTVTSGSARSLSLLTIDVAGKTGTAQNSTTRPTHAWFTGFAPYQKPTLAITVLLEEGGEGSSTAVPIARDIFNWWETHGSE